MFNVAEQSEARLGQKLQEVCLFTGSKAFPPGLAGTCVFTRHKTNTVSSCVNTTMKPPEWLPFSEIINRPSNENKLQKLHVSL